MWALLVSWNIRHETIQALQSLRHLQNLPTKSNKHTVQKQIDTMFCNQTQN